MTVLFVLLAWIVLSLFGWSFLRAAAQADRNSRIQPGRPWAPDAIASGEDARERAHRGVNSARRSHARSA